MAAVALRAIPRLSRQRKLAGPSQSSGESRGKNHRIPSLSWIWFPEFRSEFPPEFLRSDPAPPTSYNELAGPVMAPPRILEAPEIVPPPPALGGITIEAAEPKGVQRRPGIEVPLQAAPLTRRIVAAAIDGLVILLATVLFALIFWKMTALRPPLSQLLGLASPCLASYGQPTNIYCWSMPALRRACTLPGWSSSLRRNHGESPPAPLARAGVLPRRRFFGDGIRLGPAGRRLTLLARPDHAHLSCAEQEGLRAGTSAVSKLLMWGEPTSAVHRAKLDSFPARPMLSSIRLPVPITLFALPTLIEWLLPLVPGRQ